SDTTPFMHHMIADPDAGGVCRTSCDPVKSRMNGRALRTFHYLDVKRDQNGKVIVDQSGHASPVETGAVHDGDPTAFINQMLRFAIVEPAAPTCTIDPKKPDLHTQLEQCSVAPIRDMQFRLSTIGSFSPFVITLLKDTRDIAPVGVNFIPPTGELAVTDGAL